MLYAKRDWAAAFDSLAAADPSRLSAADLELLASSAYMLGRDDAYLDALELAHHSHLGAGNPARAAHCTWWIGDYLRFRGDNARATGWFARGHRLLQQAGDDCVARGYLLLPTVHRHALAGDHEAASAVAAEAGEIGELFGDRDLITLAMMQQGQALVRQGRVADGLRLVDETMVAVTTEELSPIIAGTVFCDTIAFCQAVFELGRAREWTEAHTEWCERQPEMVAYMGLCLVHRAETMALAGNWSDAMVEIRRAEGYTEGVLNERVAGHAAYMRGEVHLLQGELRRAEEAYREASRRGREPQPGLALLRLAQGEGDAAGAALRRALGEASEPLRRASLLPAYVEIMLAVGDLDQPAVPAAIWPTSQSARTAARSRRCRTTLAGPSPSPRATGGAPWPRCDRPTGRGRSSKRRARPHAPASWSGRLAPRWGIWTPPPWSWRLRATRSRAWERHRNWPESSPFGTGRKTETPTG